MPKTMNDDEIQELQDWLTMMLTEPIKVMSDTNGNYIYHLKDNTRQPFQVVNALNASSYHSNLTEAVRKFEENKATIPKRKFKL